MGEEEEREKEREREREKKKKMGGTTNSKDQFSHEEQ
jgi:hypothetical protein